MQINIFSRQQHTSNQKDHHKVPCCPSVRIQRVCMELLDAITGLLLHRSLFVEVNIAQFLHMLTGVIHVFIVFTIFCTSRSKLHASPQLTTPPFPLQLQCCLFADSDKICTVRSQCNALVLRISSKQ